MDFQFMRCPDEVGYESRFVDLLTCMQVQTDLGNRFTSNTLLSPWRLKKLGSFRGTGTGSMKEILSWA